MTPCFHDFGRINLMAWDWKAVAIVVALAAFIGILMWIDQ